MRRGVAVALSAALLSAPSALARAGPCHVFVEPLPGSPDRVDVGVAASSACAGGDKASSRVVEIGAIGLLVLPSGVRALAGQISARKEHVGSVDLTPPLPAVGSVRVDRWGNQRDRTQDYEVVTVFSWPMTRLGDLSGRPAQLDVYGLPNDTDRRFELSAGGGVALDERMQAVPAAWLGASVVFPAIPSDDEPGDDARWIPVGAPSAVAVEALIAGGRVSDLHIFAHLGLGGYLRRRIEPADGGPARGHRVLVGMGMSFDHAMHTSVQTADQLAVLGIVGPVADAAIWAGPVRFRGAAEAFVDVATVQSPAVLAFIASRGPWARETRLATRAYYFAVGGTARLFASAELAGVELAGALSADTLTSIEDPFREWKSPHPVVVATFVPPWSQEPRAIDARLVSRFWLSQTLPGGRFRLTWIDFEHRVLAGRAGGVMGRATDMRAITRITAVF